MEREADAGSCSICQCPFARIQDHSCVEILLERAEAAEKALAEARLDTERFEFYFKPTRKGTTRSIDPVIWKALTSERLWSVNKWRKAIDGAMERVAMKGAAE